MTARAVRGVTVDWQVTGPDPAALQRVLRGTPGVRHTGTVGYATTSGLDATTPATLGATTQTTGPGTVLGLPAHYTTMFPGTVRVLAGTSTGVLVAQQTAANLRVRPGDTVLIGRAALSPASVVVTGIVELPQADSLFQTVGAPPSAQPVAPPDNVILLDEPLWHTTFDPLAATRPDLVHTQIHVALDHHLPSAPADAYTAVTAAAHHLQAGAAGTLVGDNLAAALDAARSDAAYARILFLFLATPAAVLAALLTATVVATGADRRRREHALLRARGATTGQLLRLTAVEAVLTGTVGAAAGLGAAAVLGHTTFGTGLVAGWSIAAAATGLSIAAATVLIPAWRDLRLSSVAGLRTTRRIRPRRYGVDLILLAAGGLVFWATSGNGYQLVLAPEGVPAISVSYWAFAAPALLWTGAALLALRLIDLALTRGRPLLRRILAPLAGNLSGVLANSLARQRRPLARAAVLLGLALAFAASTATFTATYQTQSEMDTRLTNGADVTVTPSPGADTQPTDAARLATVPGVRAVEPIQHRYAYVGADLQDLYGVNPATITSRLQDTYFQGGTAAQLMTRLTDHEDSVLVSAETVHDFQLHPGDRLNLRLQDSQTHQLVTVPFTYAGVVAEFPTAPTDSFLVANADYVTKRTGNNAIGAFLTDTTADPAAVAARIRTLLGPTVAVTDLNHTRTTIGSSLTAVSLTGLSTVELGFGLVLATASGALVLTLRLTERRRTFAIAAALGATPKDLRAFVTAETAALSAGGLLSGALIGWLLTHVLLKVLTGVFDPPPATATIPWPYLATVTASLLAALVVVSAVTVHLARRAPTRVLREL